MYTALSFIPSTSSLLFSSDTRALLRFNADGSLEEGGCSDTECYITDMDWFVQQGKVVVDMFAAACTDGSLRFIKKSGVLEKKIAAHAGAVICVAWNSDGSSLVTGGEDGEVKIWSRNGNLRTSLFSSQSPIHALAWGPQGANLLLAHSNVISIKPTASNNNSKKTIQWEAMPKGTGVVTSADWNAVTNLIVTGGEDCVYRIFDEHGLPLYVSAKASHVITSVKWRPNGSLLAVGSYNVLRLCDKTGWTYARERPNCGSVMKIRWSYDGTMCAGACGAGVGVFAQIVNRSLEYGSITATLTDPKKIAITDCTSPNDTDIEELDFPRDRVVEFALGYDHLVVCTASQCFIYESPNYNTPQIFDLRNPVNLIVLSVKSFAIADTVQGMQIYSYEGRQLSQPRFQGLRPEFLSSDCVSLSQDVIAILDQTDMKTIRVFDVLTGRPSASGAEIKHDQEITKIALSQYSSSSLDRRLVFIDSNREMFITPTANLPGVLKKFAVQKLATQVDTCCWNDQSDLLAAIADSRLTVYYYPHALYVDKDLLPLTQETQDGSEFGKLPSIQTFFGNSITVRRADGALLTSSVPPYPAMLYEYAAGGRFKECVSLCRFVKSPQLWGTLAGMAIYHQDLDSAEVALSAVKEVDKLQYIKYIKALPSSEVRNSEMMLYKRCSEEAESILMQASPPLVYHAIKLNVRLFKWDRALDLAVKNKKHIDIVCWYRQKYLKEFGRDENMDSFKKYKAEYGDLDDDAIKAKKDEAKESELGGGGGRK
jgi:intraflagellar transport protein 80